MTDDHDPEDRKQEVLTAVLKFLGITVVVALFILVVSLIVVSKLDLNEGNGPITSTDPFSTPSYLPTVAITPTPTATPTEEPSEEPSDLPTLPTETPEPTSQAEDGLMLTATPSTVDSGDRFHLSGVWPGKDNASLNVQRFEDGEWVDFGVKASVKLGVFDTEILTYREGENRFRVFDLATGTASNDVSVTVS